MFATPRHKQCARSPLTRAFTNASIVPWPHVHLHRALTSPRLAQGWGDANSPLPSHHIRISPEDEAASGHHPFLNPLAHALVSHGDEATYYCSAVVLPRLIRTRWNARTPSPVPRCACTPLPARPAATLPRLAQGRGMHLHASTYPPPPFPSCLLAFKLRMRTRHGPTHLPSYRHPPPCEDDMEPRHP